MAETRSEMTLPWTKFQDFYLRLGFLKVLVAVLDKDRVSAANEHIYRRLRSPLFEASTSYAPRLWEKIRHNCDWYAKKHKEGDLSKPTVAEALLVDGDCPSFLFAMTKNTVYKMLDWGRDVRLVGRGNQITERGLLLRSLLPLPQVEAFRSGDAEAWNPFILESRERMFFLYHLCEIDRLTVDVMRELGTLERDSPLDLRESGRIVSRLFHGLLATIEHEVRPSELPAFRTARDLAAAMALEMNMPELLDDAGLSRLRLRPKRRSVTARPSTRQLTKQTDHQTVPRFEQLTDLGFVRKLGPEFKGPRPRRKWLWVPTELCVHWHDVTADKRLDRDFLWNGFAKAAARSLEPSRSITEIEGVLETARRTWDAYGVVGRPVGHTPLDTVALYAMIEASVDGTAFEMQRVQALMLALKRCGIASDSAFFAGGNAMDDMFIRLRKGFVEAVRSSASELSAELANEGGHR